MTEMNARGLSNLTQDVNTVPQPTRQSGSAVRDTEPAVWRRLTPAHGGRSLAVAIVAVGLVCLPLYGSASVLTLATTTLVLGVLSLSTGLLLGLTRLPSMGQAAFYGIGGYIASSVAVHLSSDAMLQLLFALVGGALGAAVAGWLVIRTTGVYFLMITLAIGEIARELSVSLSGVTGGSDGMASPPGRMFGAVDLIARDAVYWYILSVSAVVLILLYVLKHVKFGRHLSGIAQSEERMRSLGYATPYMKYATFVLAGAVAGIGGALSVAMNNFAAPSDLGFETSALALFAVLIGGRRSFAAAFGGAALIILVRDKIGPSMGGHADLALGILFVGCTLLMRGGLADLRGQWERLRGRWNLRRSRRWQGGGAGVEYDA